MRALRSQVASAPPRPEPSAVSRAAAFPRGSRAEALEFIFATAEATGEGFSHVVVGIPRYGKTYHAQGVTAECLKRGIADIALVHDAKKTTPQYDGVIRSSIAELAAAPPAGKDGVIVIHPPPELHMDDRETPERVAEAALLLARGGMPSLLVIDELFHALDSPQHWSGRAVAHVLREGGSQGVSILGTTQIPQQLPTEAFDLPQSLAVFHLGGRSAAYIAKRLGLPDAVRDHLPILGVGEFFLVTLDGCDGVIYGPA